MRVHGIHDLLCGMRTGHSQHLGVHAFDEVATASIGLGAQATCHDDFAVSANASPMVSRLSLTASSMKPQVFTMTKSAPSKVLEVS